MNEKDKQLNPCLVWCDLETTGVGDGDIILEVAVIITDCNLVQMKAFHSLVIDCNPKSLHPDDAKKPHHPRGSHPDIACWRQHFDSGLVDELIAQSDKEWSNFPTVETVQEDVVDFLSSVWSEDGDYTRPPLCGLSVHFDRRFLRRYMPKVHNMLDHRNIDVSSIRELQKRWRPEMMESMPKRIGAHRAMSDLRESIELLRALYNTGFIGG